MRLATVERFDLEHEAGGDFAIGAVDLNFAAKLQPRLGYDRAQVENRITHFVLFVVELLQLDAQVAVQSGDGVHAHKRRFNAHGTQDVDFLRRLQMEGRNRGVVRHLLRSETQCRLLTAFFCQSFK